MATADALMGGSAIADLTQKEVLKLLKQLGRATKRALAQLFRQANRMGSEQAIADALNACSFSAWTAMCQNHSETDIFPRNYVT